MNDRTKRFWVGIVVFATMLITAILIVVNSNVSWAPFSEKYQIKVLVDQAPGVAPNTPVRRHGILIGRVADVIDTDDGAEITINIDQGKVVKTNEIARVQASLIGDAVIEFVPDRPKKDAQAVAPGTTVRGIHNPNPMELMANLQGDLKQTIMSLGMAGDEVAALAGRLNSVLGEQDVERLSRLVESMETGMNQFSSVMGHLDDILGDDEFKKQLKEGLAQMPSLISDIRAVMGGIEGAIGSADQNLKNLQGLTGPLGERGDEIVASLEKSAINLQELLGQVALFTKSINASKGTIGMLIHDRKLADQLRTTMNQVTITVSDASRLIANVEFMSRKLRPILDDVRTITDKVARDPSRVLRGVLKPEARIKSRTGGRQY